jgi:hypothetical protein
MTANPVRPVLTPSYHSRTAAMGRTISYRLHRDPVDSRLSVTPCLRHARLAFAESLAMSVHVLDPILRIGYPVV